MADAIPLLTLAIPTYNRAAYLAELLEVLLPQLAQMAPGTVEFLVSDNASADGTAELLRQAGKRLRAEAPGVAVRMVRQLENIGSDRNFVYCFRAARGRYFWLCGDDDILRPGALTAVVEALRAADYDWIFLPPEPFARDWRAEFQPDPHGRGAQVVRSARQMALRVNVMVTFISGMVVHRERVIAMIEAGQAEPPEAFVHTHLTQLSWTLPLLREHRQSLILWQRYVMGRQLNSGGYSIGQVFGGGFAQLVNRLLPGQPRLAAVFQNVALRLWFPATMLQLRQQNHGDRFALHEAEALLRHTFRGNFRYWLFTWPVMRLPLSAAQVWQRAGAVVARVLRLLHHPGDVRLKQRSRASRSAALPL